MAGSVDSWFAKTKQHRCQAKRNADHGVPYALESLAIVEPGVVAVLRVLIWVAVAKALIRKPFVSMADKHSLLIEEVDGCSLVVSPCWPRTSTDIPYEIDLCVTGLLIFGSVG